jgi:hypothetical protein
MYICIISAPFLFISGSTQYGFQNSDFTDPKMLSEKTPAAVWCAEKSPIQVLFKNKSKMHSIKYM